MLINQRERETLTELVGIDSVNPMADPTHRGEQAIVDYLADLCRKLGLEVCAYSSSRFRCCLRYYAICDKTFN